MSLHQLQSPNYTTNLLQIFHPDGDELMITGVFAFG